MSAGGVVFEFRTTGAIEGHEPRVAGTATKLRNPNVVELSFRLSDALEVSDKSALTVDNPLGRSREVFRKPAQGFRLLVDQVGCDPWYEGFIHGSDEFLPFLQPGGECDRDHWSSGDCTNTHWGCKEGFECLADRRGGEEFEGFGRVEEFFDVTVLGSESLECADDERIGDRRTI